MAKSWRSIKGKNGVSARQEAWVELQSRLFIWLHYGKLCCLQEEYSMMWCWEVWCMVSNRSSSCCVVISQVFFCLKSPKFFWWTPDFIETCHDFLSYKMWPLLAALQAAWTSRKSCAISNGHEATKQKTLILNVIVKFAHFQLECFEVWLERGSRSSLVFYDQPEHHSCLLILPRFQASGEAAEIHCTAVQYQLLWWPPIFASLA